MDELKNLYEAVKQKDAQRQSCALHGTDEDCDKAKAEYNLALKNLFACIETI